MTFLGILAILFIALKLTAYIDWSWWFVLMPVYIPAVVVFIFVFAATIIRGKK
jgi:hypothetical protein